MGSCAVKGLGAVQRAKAGKAGGVIMLVYMAAFVVPKGKSLKDMLGGEFLPWMKFDVCSPAVPLWNYISDKHPPGRILPRWPRSSRVLL